MNAFLTIFSYFIQLAPAAVLGIQTIHGDKIAGKDKKAMAQDALKIAAASVLPVLPGNQQQLGALAAMLAGTIIDATVVKAKADGSYAAATAASKTVDAPEATPAQ